MSIASVFVLIEPVGGMRLFQGLPEITVKRIPKPCFIQRYTCNPTTKMPQK